MNIVIGPAAPADEADILRLVEACGLPPDGLSEHLGNALVARADGRIVACAALEISRDGALLRSVAVDETWRGSGLGQQMVRAALALARERGVSAVFLLTTTAEGFFPRFGFVRVPRAAVPESVRASVEFQSACPASAVVMSLRTEAPRRHWERATTVATKQI